MMDREEIRNALRRLDAQLRHTHCDIDGITKYVALRPAAERAARQRDCHAFTYIPINCAWWAAQQPGGTDLFDLPLDALKLLAECGNQVATALLPYRILKEYFDDKGSL